MRLIVSVAALAMCLANESAGNGALWIDGRAQEQSLVAERTIEYELGRVHQLKARVGPVTVHSVEFSDRGRGSSPGGLAGLVRGGGGGSEASTTIRSHFVVENPSSDDWRVTFTLDFLDRSGKLIDRAEGRHGWEGETKPYDFDHSILQYVVPSIDRIRIKLEGRLD